MGHPIFLPAIEVKLPLMVSATISPTSFLSALHETCVFFSFKKREKSKREVRPHTFPLNCIAPTLIVLRCLGSLRSSSDS